MDSANPPEFSSRYFKYWIIDRPNRRQRVITQHDGEYSIPIAEGDAILDSQLKETIFDWEKWWVINTTLRNDLVIAEAYSPLPGDPLKGRPVVYLDQNHWSTLALARVDPARIKKKSEVDPALELIRLASDAGIVLPLSSANIRETSALYGDRRYEMGIAMGQLAGGWTMRHPMWVRKLELAQSIAAALALPIPPKRPTFTLEPNAIFIDRQDAGSMSPTDMQLFKLAQISPSVILDLLLDPTADPSPDLPAWVTTNQGITDHLKTSQLTIAEKRKFSYFSSVQDHTAEILSAHETLGIEKSSLAHFTVDDWTKLFRSTKMSHLYTHITMLRHINKNTRWTKNDLTDMAFLSCASAYADFVAAENRTSEDLRQARKAASIENNVFPSLEKLVEALNAADVKTASEQA